MCMKATCSDCSKKTWRGCGNHIPSAMAGVDEAEWCTCGPQVEVGGKMYPRAAGSFLGSLFGGSKAKKSEERKDEL
ncbi:unnamed protein product [Discula destructiva]